MAEGRRRRAGASYGSRGRAASDDGGGADLAILGVEKTASHEEIKKAYYKLALRLHPDKNPGDEEAKEKFQQLQEVISILGDAEKRALYDEAGIAADDALVGEAADNLQEYFRTIYKKNGSRRHPRTATTLTMAPVPIVWW